MRAWANLRCAGAEAGHEARAEAGVRTERRCVRGEEERARRIDIAKAKTKAGGGCCQLLREAVGVRVWGHVRVPPAGDGRGLCGGRGGRRGCGRVETRFRTGHEGAMRSWVAGSTSAADICVIRQGAWVWLREEGVLCGGEAR